MTGPFAGLTVHEAARRIRDGGTDPVALVERTIEAIGESQPVLNAFVRVDSDGALRAAAVARDELARGTDRGVLHGLPVAVKDIVDTAGVATTMGSRHFAGNVPARDAEVVARLREAGAIIVGKTVTHEFAYGPFGDRSADGPSRNPHDPARMSGGSSGGSAAAVAAGLVPLAVGTDTGGSVRIPAALCGVVGIRPTFGSVPGDGVFPLSGSLDTAGVLAADVAGTAVGWRILTGASGDSATAPSDGAALRVGLVAGPWFDRLDGTVRARFDAFVTTLSGRVAGLEPVPVPDAEELHALYVTVQSAEAAAIHHERLTSAPQLFDPEVRQRLEIATAVPAHSYATAMRRLAEVRAGAARRLDGFDLLVLPTVPVVAPPLFMRDAIAGWASTREALLGHDALWGVLGLPAVSIPIPSPGDLPVGAQLVGPPGGDAALLATAETIARW
jgi:Asp-tRNA(Asn)/Glu-tRNA(Gln) amidotransferase A subunit family amidase